MELFDAVNYSEEKSLKAILGDAKAIKEILEQNYFDLLNLALLARSGNKQIVHLLLKQDVDKDIVFKQASGKEIPLHLAAKSGNLEFCEKFIQKFPNLINHQDKGGWTALHRAANSGEVGVVKLLLKSGVNRAKKDNQGYTAEEIANQKYLQSFGELQILQRESEKNIQKISELVEIKENMQEVSEVLETSFFESLFEKYEEFKGWCKAEWTIIVDKWNNSFLAGFCCSADAVDDGSPNNNSETNPSSSVEDEINSTNSSSSVEDEINLTAVKQQLDSFLKDKNSISKASLEQNYFNLLNSALEENNMTAVHLLLKEDVDINAVLKQAFGKEIPLHLAAKSGNLEFCKKFIQKFPNSINHQDEGGWTALHFATFYYKKKVARLLIDSGANMTIKNRRDFTPAEIYTKFNPGDSPNVFFEPKKSEAFHKRDTCNIL